MANICIAGIGGCRPQGEALGTMAPSLEKLSENTSLPTHVWMSE